jgi:hypothetical protein
LLGLARRRTLNHPAAVSLERFVPLDQFSRYLDATLDLSFIRRRVADLYPTTGRSSIDPAFLLL